MILDFFSISQKWGEGDGRNAEEVFQDLVSSFWRGEFESLGPDVGGSAVLMTDRHLNKLCFYKNDRSFLGQRVTRVDILKAFAIAGIIPDCGIGRYLNWPAEERHTRALVAINSDDVVMHADAFGRLQDLPTSNYQLKAVEMLRCLGLELESFRRWLALHDLPTPAFLDRRDAEEPSAPMAQMRRGRRRKYDWDSMHAWIQRNKEDDPDWLPERQADLEERAADWFSKQTEDGISPSESMIRDQVRRYYA